MPLRNPFRRPAAGADTVEYDARDSTAVHDLKNGVAEGTRAIEIPEPTEFKLSEINDSGVYLPPSPPESKGSFWQTRSATSTTTTTTSSSNPRSLFNENEPFNMSRESFDSYRRSFDISARSPVPSEYSVPTRQSLDSRRAPPPPRPTTAAFNGKHGRGSHAHAAAPLEEASSTFEEVKLTDDGSNNKATTRRKGIFGFVGPTVGTAPRGPSDVDRAGAGAGAAGHHFFSGRKRGQSGGGAELRAMERPTSSGGAKQQRQQQHEVEG